MWTLICRVVGTAIAAACLAGAAHGQGIEADRSLTVDDLLGLEAFGRAAISPDGRWAIYERRGPYDTMPRIEANGRSTWQIMELWVVDLSDPTSPEERLLPHEGLGLQFAAWSPSSDHLLITRLQGDGFEYGIVSLVDRSVRWTGLTPDLPLGGATATWASANTLLLPVRPDHSLPLALGYDRTSTRRRAEAWERTAEGREPSRTVIDARGGVVVPERPEPRQALVRLERDTLQITTLQDGWLADFTVSPDGGSVAVVMREEPIPLGDPQLLHMEDDRRRRLVLIDLRTGRVPLRVDGLDIAPHLLRWSPDSTAVLVWARPDGARWDEGTLMSASFESTDPFNRGGLRAGASASVVVAGVQADWLGLTPVMYARPTEGERGDWYLLSQDGVPESLTGDLVVAPTRIAASGPEGLLAFADGRYWEITAHGAHALSPPNLNLREAMIFDLTMGRRSKSNEAPRRDWSIAIDGEGQVRLVRDGAAPTLGGGGADLDKTLAVSPEAVLTLRPRGLADALLHHRPGSTEAIAEVNSTLANMFVTEPRPIRHLGFDGRETESWLFLPNGEPRGVIVNPYPGWADNLARLDPLTMTYSFRPEVFVGAGYAVLSPSVPGDLPVRERGDAYARSVDLAVDAALAAFPELPSDRMVLWGHSFGGYSALEIATRSGRFRSYIASSAYSDMLGVWGEFDALGRIQPENGMFFRFNQGWTETGQGALQDPPWRAPEDYAASSPFLRADHITRPILFLTADLDFTPATQAERMFSAILRNHGHARIVTYWGEKHLTWSPANIRDRYQQIFDWLALTLDDAGSETTPADAPKGEPILQTPPP